MAFYTNPLDYCRFWPISLWQTHSKCKILYLRQNICLWKVAKCDLKRCNGHEKSTQGRILDLVTCPPLVGKCCMLKLEQIRGRKEFGIYGALSPFGREMQSAKCPIW